MDEFELSYLGKIDEGAVGDAKARNLIEWFNKGADGKIRWGTPGDFDACVRIAGKHMSPEKAKGFCANRHHTVTGEWPGPDAHKSEGTQMTGMAYGWAPITKIEDQPDGTVIVHGPMSSVGLDRDRQRFSQAFLDRAIPQWFGESGNIREQHDPKRAVGNALQVKRDDATGVWDLAAHVVDSEAVKKIRNKVLKGFSVGVKGPHVTYGKADAPGGEIDDGIICETSVVDRPSNPVTIFQVVKSDGDGDELLFEPGDGLIEKAITHAPAGSPGGGQFLPGGVDAGGGSGLDETRKGAAKVAVTGGGGGKAGGGGGAKKAAKKAAPAKITPAQRAAAAQAKRDQAAAVRAAAAKVRAAQAATKAQQAAAAKAAATPAGKAQQAAGKAHPTSITPGPLVRPAADPAPTKPTQKADEMDEDEFEGSGDVDPTENTDPADEAGGEDDEMPNDPRVDALIAQAEAMEAMLVAQADEIAGLTEKLDQANSEAEVAKVDEPGLIKAAVAEVGAAYEGRLATIEAELTKALAMPAPGGPVQMRTSTQAVLAQAREKADVRAQIDELTTKADQFRTTDRELADGYDERARRLMRTLNG